MEQQMQAANLTAKVYKKIRKEILRGTYKPGQSLTELALTKSMEVSRTPVREALRQLEMEGLVELRPNRGAVVIGINGQDIEDIYEIRSMVEGRAAEMAALADNEVGVRQLSEIVDLTEFYVIRKKFDRLMELDDRFHRSIYEMTGSRMYQRILADLHAYAEHVRERSMKEPGRAEKMVAEHRAILEAISSGDSHEARNLMVQHIQRCTENMEKNHILDIDERRESK